MFMTYLTLSANSFVEAQRMQENNTKQLKTMMLEETILLAGQDVGSTLWRVEEKRQGNPSLLTSYIGDFNTGMF